MRPTTGASDVVLDANVLVRLVVPGDYEQQAETLWNQLISSGQLCAVPSFCPAEVISSLRQMGRAGSITPEREEQALEEFLMDIRPVLITLDTQELIRATWQIARDLNERHTYDSVYLAVARAFELEFWTADQQLLRRLNGRFPEARFLGDYPLAPSRPEPAYGSSHCPSLLISSISSSTPRSAETIFFTISRPR